MLMRELEIRSTCRRCNGHGITGPDENMSFPKCDECGGTGYVIERLPLSFRALSTKYAAIRAVPYVLPLASVGALTWIAASEQWSIHVEGFYGNTPEVILLFGLFCVLYGSAWVRERRDDQWPKRRRKRQREASER
jgi:hypothetical protein